MDEGPNEIAILAKHAHSGATSAPRRVTYAPLESRKSKLYMVSIGISDYHDSGLSLDYAAKDARAMAELFRRQESKLYREVIVRELYDDDATKDAVIEALEWLGREVTQNDTAVLFVAAHGDKSDGGVFYMLPVDAQPSRLRQTGVSGRLFAELLGHLPSPVLFFIDACYSGDLAQEFKDRSSPDDLLKEAIWELTSAGSGVVVVASSTGRERSREYGHLEHDAFTYALIKALDHGEADVLPDDGFVYLHELQGDLPEKVKNLTDGRQHSVVKSSGSITRLPLVQVPKPEE
jgi:uncharacterized caspase-like protein